MTELEKAADAHLEKLQSTMGRFDEFSTGDIEHAFLAGAAWRREQDLAILRSSKADQFLATYNMYIAADYLEAASKQENGANDE